MDPQEITSHPVLGPLAKGILARIDTSLVAEESLMPITRLPGLSWNAGSMNHKHNRVLVGSCAICCAIFVLHVLCVLLLCHRSAPTIAASKLEAPTGCIYKAPSTRLWMGQIFATCIHLEKNSTIFTLQ